MDMRMVRGEYDETQALLIYMYIYIYSAPSSPLHHCQIWILTPTPKFGSVVSTPKFGVDEKLTVKKCVLLGLSLTLYICTPIPMICLPILTLDGTINAVQVLLAGEWMSGCLISAVPITHTCMSASR